MPIPVIDLSVDVSPSAITFLDDRIVQIVNERSGIKETDLTMDIMIDVKSNLDDYFDPITVGINAEIIFSEIHRMIQEGRIVGVDCEIGDSGYTFLVPSGTRLRVAMPVQDNRTRH